MTDQHVHTARCNHSSMLKDIAHQAMIDRGLQPDFSAEARKQAESISGAAAETDASIKDLRELLWCSIDNDDSRDLDQLTVAEDLGGGNIRAMVAVADVDALVKKGTPIDDHARTNTTSVYTASQIFPMLPEKLSTNLTSLNEHEERIAVVMDMTIASDGSVTKGEVFRARVHNKAQLAYNAVGMWLEGKGEMPAKIKAVPGLAENLKIQDGHVVDLQIEARNNAKNLIEDFMVAANGVSARFLASKGFASLRRVVRSPERWDRIEAIAAKFGEKLPSEPDSQALEEFLIRRRKADPLRFPDLSLSIVKAMGAGEYVVEQPGQTSIGHFGLAVKDYTHSTAPNRRFPDLITHRLMKAALAGAKTPYTSDELTALATHCTEAEDAANKVERQVRKSAAACILEDRIGQRFDGIVTGASEKGTWVRIFHPPVEGKVVHGAHGVDVGDKVNVKLVDVNVERGYIDFVR